MKLLSAFVIIVSLAATAFASPLEKRASGGVLLCTGPNATGVCQHEVYKLDACIAFGPPFLNNLTTFAPDGDDFICYPRSIGCGVACKDSSNCALASIDFNYEHKYNLTVLGWSKPALSFDCRKKEKNADDTHADPTGSTSGTMVVSGAVSATAPVRLATADPSDNPASKPTSNPTSNTESKPTSNATSNAASKTATLDKTADPVPKKSSTIPKDSTVVAATATATSHAAPTTTSQPDLVVVTVTETGTSVVSVAVTKTINV